ncbi:hypothetical protein BG452_13545 [Streptomyces sp. CBMA123]|nr:hypothetical protein [Streptomyces sp. CBMA123]
MAFRLPLRARADWLWAGCRCGARPEPATRRSFTINTEPHVAEIGDVELAFLPEVETPTWQLVTLPVVPVYCLDTHAEASPSLRNPVSSMINVVGFNSVCILHASRARTCAGSHGLLVTRCASALPVAVLAQPGRHRLHRPAPAVQQQPTHIDLSPTALIVAGRRLEQLRRERLQVLPDRPEGDCLIGLTGPDLSDDRSRGSGASALVP